MSDDISIPHPTYRVPRHSRGMDPGTRKLAMIAAGIGGGLVVIFGGWHLISHHHQGVPVVMAEPGPMRIKPVNPGGLHVAGIGNDIFSGGSDTDVEKLAPPPQTPDPQALQAMVPPKPAAASAARASVGAASAAATSLAATSVAATSAASASATANPAPPASAAMPAPPPTPAIVAHQPPPVARPLARETPSAAPSRHTAETARPTYAAAVPQHRPAENPAPATTADDHARSGRHVQVQLAALSSEQAARDEWARLARRWPDLFGDRRAAISKVAHDGHIFWRVRTGGFEDVSQATVFCERLRAKGGGCSVADF